ncbi:hypothetical protein LTR53_013701 [Teratosphaeriaceae sp. CCFEE 6253]|nr:hypothetical protein LTR53_013701 [Teratosphaeriaceae sp. CCFEE 6253]
MAATLDSLDTTSELGTPAASTLHDEVEEEEVMPMPSTEGCSTTPPTVQVIVGQGDEAYSFDVHQNVLVKHSRFFAAALRPAWRPEAGVIDLHDYNAAEFSIFVAFLYGGKILTPDSYLDSSKDEPKIDFLARLWLLGNRLMSVTFQDAVADVLIDDAHAAGHVPNTLHHTIYTLTVGDCALRRLAVDFAAIGWGWDHLAETPAEGHGEFFRDVAVRSRDADKERYHEDMYRLGRGTSAFFDCEFDRCLYHEHGPEAPCHNTRFARVIYSWGTGG